MWKKKKTKEEANYDALVKTAMMAHLGEAVREVQRQQAAAPYHSDAAIESNSEAAHTFCCVVEALFVHKLRDSFVDKVSSVFSGDIIRQPSPNFWPFLLAFSHRNSIDFVLERCSWLRSDIGRCRGWIRLVLNDGMLSSYLELLSTEQRLLNDFYEKEAFLRDAEKLDIARKMLNGVEVLQFRLAVNSSMLNSWSTTPLLLAGLWAPPTPVVEEAVVQGIDAALCFSAEETLQAVQYTSQHNSPSAVSVDEDLAFRLIVKSGSDSASTPLRLLPLLDCPLDTTAAVTPSKIAADDESLSDTEEVLVTHLRPKSSRTCSPAVPEEPQDEPKEGVEEETNDELKEEIQEDLVKELEQLEAQEEERGQEPAPGAAQVPDAEMTSSCTFEDLLENYCSLTVTGLISEITPADSHQEEPEFEELDPVSDDCTQSPFLALLPTLNQEKGLVFQNYRCADCSRPIGIIYGAMRLCSFSGLYYCSDCHCDDEAIIPARVFLNGDWSRRKVCRAVHQFFSDVQLEPLLDAIEYNRNIYSIETEFREVLTLRSQLVHLSAYLLTCRSDAKELFCTKMLDKEHIYREEHTYTLADLPCVQSGQLRQHLLKVLEFGKKHVSECELCSAKGFICEACRSDVVIFPFDLEMIYRCCQCGSIFHKDCMNPLQLCPRCQRWKKSAHDQDEDLLS